MKIEFTISKINDVVVVDLAGKLDSSNYLEVDAKFNDIIASGERKLMINFFKLDYISSAGLRVFLSVAKKLKAANGKFVFTKMQEHVREVFDLTGLLHVFTLCDREEDAIKTLAD